MNRKLLRTLSALSASATVFAVLLLAGQPVASPLPDAALSRGPAAVLPAEATVVDDAGLALPGDEVSADAVPVARHGAHRTRSLMVLPYFSFAQGLRRSRS